jgi:hypothetical protein
MGKSRRKSWEHMGSTWKYGKKMGKSRKIIGRKMGKSIGNDGKINREPREPGKSWRNGHQNGALLGQVLLPDANPSLERN